MGASSINWEAVTAIATAVTALGVPVSAGFIWVQLRQAKEAGQAQVLQLKQAAKLSETQVEQLRQSKNISQAQVYQTLLDRAERVHLNRAMDAVRSLTCTSYEDYSALEEGIRNQVRVAVEFFNEIRHLLPPDSNMIELDYVRSLWGLSILSCADKLWTRQAWLDELPISWWLVGFRNEQAGVFHNPDASGLFYRGFERLCWRFKRLEDPGNCRDEWDLPDESWYY